MCKNRKKIKKQNQVQHAVTHWNQPDQFMTQNGSRLPAGLTKPHGKFCEIRPLICSDHKKHVLLPMKGKASSEKKKKNEETSLRAFFSVSSCELRINCGRRCVSICVSSVRLTNVCYTCTDVSSIPHIVFLESMYILKRIMVFFFFCESPLSLCASSLFVACSSQPRF